MAQLKEVLTALEAQRASLQKELTKIEAAIKAVASIGSEDQASPAKQGKRRGMSAAGRARIAAAQKARWAKAKKQTAKKVTAPVAKPAKKRKMSAAGLAKIRAAVKARWAKVKAEKQTKAPVTAA